MSNKKLLKHLKKFLEESGKADYANTSPESWIKEKDGSRTIEYVSGDWRFHDNFFGGEPYGGRIVIHHKGNPIWIFVYYGWIEPFVKDIQKVYDFLKLALNANPENKIFRGPKRFVHKEFIYKNSRKGGLETFFGEEAIYQNEKEVYKAKYMGGLVDKRKGV